MVIMKIRYGTKTVDAELECLLASPEVTREQLKRLEQRAFLLFQSIYDPAIQVRHPVTEKWWQEYNRKVTPLRQKTSK